uniref:parathymosin-like n=1 Tax=Myxine glutinosa TaxID=7769 RepID=UPI00358F307B
MAEKAVEVPVTAKKESVEKSAKDKPVETQKKEQKDQKKEQKDQKEQKEEETAANGSAAKGDTTGIEKKEKDEESKVTTKDGKEKSPKKEPEKDSPVKRPSESDNTEGEKKKQKTENGEANEVETSA